MDNQEKALNLQGFSALSQSPLFEIFYGNWSGSENPRGEDGFLDTHELTHNPE